MRVCEPVSSLSQPLNSAVTTQEATTNYMLTIKCDHISSNLRNTEL